MACSRRRSKGLGATSSSETSPGAAIRANSTRRCVAPRTRSPRASSGKHGARPSCEGRARSLAASARLLREGRTNGALFLALPANGPDRNSINDTGSLLRTLCRSAEATSCRGRGAEQAQFRTDGGTWPRLAGLLLIAIGAVGMLLMFGAVALRLLLAAVIGSVPAAARTGRRARSGPRRARARAVPSVDRAAVRGDRDEARLRLPARCQPARYGRAGGPPGHRMVGPVAARLGVLVGDLPSPSRAARRALRARDGPPPVDNPQVTEERSGPGRQRSAHEAPRRPPRAEADRAGRDRSRSGGGDTGRRRHRS